MSFTQQMVSSLRNNDRRKQKHIPFEKKDTVKKGNPINSKKYGPVGKHNVEQLLKKKEDNEKEQRIYKIILTLIITILVIFGITYSIKLIYF